MLNHRVKFLCRMIVITITLITLSQKVNHSQANPLITRGSQLLIKALSKSKRALSIQKIKELTKLSKLPKGTKLVGQALGKMKLPTEVIEDSYLRIAVAKGRLSPDLASNWFRTLRGTPGFRSALSKSIGQSLVKAKGHLNEVEIAAQSHARGLKVVGIGTSFKDPAKSALTDIDVLLESNGKTIALEAKDYLPTTRLPMDQFRSDLDTLATYCKDKQPCVPIFTLTHKPVHAEDLTRIAVESQKRGVELLIGDPSSQSEQIKLLSEVL